MTTTTSPKAPATRIRNLRGRSLVVLTFRLAFVIWITLTLWPVSYGVTRAAQVILVLFCCGCALFLWGRTQWVRWTMLTVSAFCVVVAFWPARAASHETLREHYVRELQGFNGVRYVWGGENNLGIDCSGLVRRAWVQALCKEGLFTGNPGLIRQAALVWWYDSSAKALAAEYRHETVRLLEAERILEIDPSDLLPGDLAVTSDGVHALAYLGGHDWIEADPGERKVITVSALKDDDSANGWLKLPVTILRWRLLAERYP